MDACVEAAGAVWEDGAELFSAGAAVVPDGGVVAGADWVALALAGGVACEDGGAGWACNIGAKRKEPDERKNPKNTIRFDDSVEGNPDIMAPEYSNVAKRPKRGLVRVRH